MSDIVERLRTRQPLLGKLCDEAADEIETLHTHLEHRSDANTQLRAEVERLKAALRHIAECDECDYCPNKARDALRGKP